MGRKYEKAYQVVDLRKEKSPGFFFRRSIEDVVSDGETPFPIRDAGFGFGAYKNEELEWDSEKVEAIFEDHGILFLISTSIVTGAYRIAVPLGTPNPDEVVAAFLEDIKNEVIQQPNLEFKIKDGNIYGIFVPKSVPVEQSPCPNNR